MFEWILLFAGLLGFTVCGYLDLKTTEFPDWLPYSMILTGLGVHGLWALSASSLHIFMNSLLTGGVLLAFGLALYFAKQWGDGDAWLLGAMGFMFPTSLGFTAAGAMPFPLVLMFNFFFVALAYLIGYSFLLGFRQPKVWRKFSGGLRKDWKMIVLVLAAATAACLGGSFYLSYSFGVPLQMMGSLLTFPVLVAFILLFVRYCRIVETDLFRKKMPVSKVRVGDVLISQKWKGITEKELAALKKKGGTCVIKEGVRFAPVFVITVLISLFCGSIVALF